MKAINNIIADIRDLAANRDWHNHTNQSNRERLLDIANSIEQAVTNCNQLKMREALLIVKKLFDGQIMFQNAIREAHKAVNDALSALPLYETEDEAYQAYLKEMEDTPEEAKVFFESWLFAKLKGETK